MKNKTIKKTFLIICLVSFICMAYAEEQETVFKLKNGGIIKARNPYLLIDVALKMKSGMTEGDVELLHLKRVEFTDNSCIATFHNGESMAFPMESLHRTGMPVKYLITNADSNSIPISEIESVEINREKYKPLKLWMDALITDSSGKLHEAVCVGHSSYVPNPGQWQTGYAIHVEPNAGWHRYLWIWDIKSAKRIESNLFEFVMDNGEITTGRWREQLPEIYTVVFSKGGIENLYWYSLVNGDYVRFYTRVDNIDRIEFKSNEVTAGEETKKDRIIENMRPATITTAKGEVKADACFLAMASGSYKYYTCYPQFDPDIRLLPEDYNNIRDSYYVPMKDISRVELFDKPNEGYYKGIRIYGKDAEIISGYLVSLGESYGGQWNYANCFPRHHKLVCYQKNGALVVPLDDVVKIEWK